MSYQDVLFEVDGPVATITLNRPEALNAWTDEMGEELADAVGRAEADPEVVGIVLTGAGRGFCAGADMNMLSSMTSGSASGAETEAAEALLRATPRPGDADAGDDLRGKYTYFMSLSKPVIAAITGAVAGMGVPIALACDLRFMSTEAVLTTSFAQRGLIAEWGIAWQLSRLAGPSNALDLLFSARKIKGEEAARLGLVNRALPPDEVLPAAQAYVTDLAANCSPSSIAVMKRQVYLDLHRGLGAAQSAANELMLASFTRPDFAEGVRSYTERRPPAFPPVGSSPIEYR
jgi:enoyl-CoA hydratase/carnithine racemase